MIIAVIPARGGSKRIKKKNIKKFLNRPIISYPIKEIQRSKLFDKIIVSTDNKEITKISKKIGAEVLFRRPKKLSGDYATTQEVIIHAAQRQPYIDQGQSLNLMIPVGTSVKEINELMVFAWEQEIKSLYYQRSSNISQDLARSIMTCKSCEG